jgi:hypothetical protein
MDPIDISDTVIPSYTRESSSEKSQMHLPYRQTPHDFEVIKLKRPLPRLPMAEISIVKSFIKPVVDLDRLDSTHPRQHKKPAFISQT